MKKKLSSILLCILLCIIMVACEAPPDYVDPTAAATEETEPEPEPEETPVPEETAAPDEEPEQEEQEEEEEAVVTDYSPSDLLSDDLYSFQLQFNNDVFQLPIQFADFEKMGWVFQDDASMTLEPYQYLISGGWRKDDGTQVFTSIINFAPDVMPITECVVTGIIIHQRNLENGDAFFMPQGIQLAVSTEDELRAAYGEPTEVIESESYNYLDYILNSDQNVEFMIEVKTGIVSDIDIENMIETDDTAQEYVAGDINEVPAVVGQYVAPSELGDDFDAATIELEGDLYTFPAPVAEFEKNGWEITDAPDSFVAQDTGFITIEKDNQSLSAFVRNYGDKETIPSNCFVYSLSGGDSFDITIPCDITFGMSDTELKSVLDQSGAEYEVREDSSYNLYNIEGTYVIITRDGKVDDIEINNMPKAAELFTS